VTASVDETNKENGDATVPEPKKENGDAATDVDSVITDVDAATDDTTKRATRSCAKRKSDSDSNIDTPTVNKTCKKTPAEPEEVVVA